MMSSEDTLEIEEGEKVPERKPVRISLHLIAKRHLPDDSQTWPQDKILNELNKITHVRLDRENIGTIDSFELLGPKVKNVYLQHNLIKEIENLDYLTGLSFLTLSSNQIRVIQGLSHLCKLTFLDLSSNLIVSFDIDELPQSLIVLSLKGNPCTNISDHRGRIVQDLPKLRQLDDEEVTKTERRDAGYVVSSSSGSEDEEEEEEELVVRRGTSTLGKCIEEVFSTTTSDILWRSQSRMEDTLKDHKRRMLQLDRIREDGNLPRSPRSQGHPVAGNL